MTPFVTLLFAIATLGQLEPAQVAVLVNKSSSASREVGEYYVKARGIPAENILTVEMPLTSTITRKDWDTRVRPSLQKMIVEKKIDNQIRCIVTTYDCPLVIEGLPKDDKIDRQRLEFLKSERESRLRYLGFLLGHIEKFLVEGGPEPKLPAKDAPIDEWRSRIQDAFRGAGLRASKITDPQERQQALRQLQEPSLTVGGLSSQISLLSAVVADSPNLDEAAKQRLLQQIAHLRGQRQGILSSMDVVSALPELVSRDDRTLQLAQRANGVLGSVFWIDVQIRQIDQGESSSAFDSELTLLFWPDYAFTGWLPNSLHESFANDFFAQNRTTLMVSRLEAPTVAITKRMVDDAIATEKEGLTGTAYIDARGFGPDAKDGYGKYDESLRRLAEFMKANSTLPVVLDNDGELFAEGSCPDCALYCGWYSLAKYVPSCTFNRGAVGYHIASSEAATLRDPKSQVWCKRMLEEGAAATLGPVQEPYVSAFPLPDEFFPLLLGGKLTLAEVYFKTLPFNSWRMILIGDPLYCPFKNKPGLKGPTARQDEGPPPGKG